VVSSGLSGLSGLLGLLVESGGLLLISGDGGGDVLAVHGLGNGFVLFLGGRGFLELVGNGLGEDGFVDGLLVTTLDGLIGNGVEGDNVEGGTVLLDGGCGGGINNLSILNGISDNGGGLIVNLDFSVGFSGGGGFLVESSSSSGGLNFFLGDFGDLIGDDLLVFGLNFGGGC